MAGRPRTTIGTYGTIANRRCKPGGWIAETRVRDADGRLRQVRVRGRTSNLATARLKDRLLTRPAFGAAGVLRPDSAFDELADEWLKDLEIQDLTHRTREAYRDRLRLHVRPAMEHYTLGEITTGRVERFLKSEVAISYPQVSHSRTALNLLFAFALRHDAITRNPVEGISPLPRPKNAPKALTLVQVTKPRVAAATWRTEPGLPGPKSDGQVRDIIEVLLGTAMRPGEVLALRACDVTDGPRGMVAHVTGTVTYHKKKGVVRQAHPKTEASDRYVPVPAFAAKVIRRRLKTIKAADRERTIFANRTGGPLNPYNVRRTFREFVVLAGLDGTGISMRWYRRTGATVLARGLGTDTAATFLGHTSSKITEGYYIEPDLTVDHAPAALLDRTRSVPKTPRVPCSPHPPSSPRRTSSTRSTPLQTTTSTAQRRAVGLRCAWSRSVADAVPVSHRNRALRPGSHQRPLHHRSVAPAPAPPRPHLFHVFDDRRWRLPGCLLPGRTRLEADGGVMCVLAGQTHAPPKSPEKTLR